MNQRRRLLAGERSAIRIQSKEKHQDRAILLLQRNLKNGSLHCNAMVSTTIVVQT